MRASVSMPRSPTNTTRSRPKRRRRASICEGTVAGSAVEPSKTSTATGQPSRLHRRPNSIWSFAALAVAGVAVAGQRTAAAFHIDRGQIVEHQRAVFQMPLRQPPLNGVLALKQPVHGGVEIVFADLAESEFPGQRGRGRCRRPAPGRWPASSPGRGCGRRSGRGPVGARARGPRR